MKTNHNSSLSNLVFSILVDSRFSKSLCFKGWWHSLSRLVHLQQSWYGIFVAAPWARQKLAGFRSTILWYISNIWWKIHGSGCYWAQVLSNVYWRYIILLAYVNCSIASDWPFWLFLSVGFLNVSANQSQQPHIINLLSCCLSPGIGLLSLM